MINWRKQAYAAATLLTVITVVVSALVVVRFLAGIINQSFAVDERAINEQAMSFDRQTWNDVKSRLRPISTPTTGAGTNVNTNVNVNVPLPTPEVNTNVNIDINANANTNLNANLNTNVPAATPEPAPPVPPPPLLPPPDKNALKLVVLNASGVKGRAAEVKSALELQGFVVQSIGNASTSGAAETVLQLKADKEAYAALLKAALQTSYPIARQEVLQSSTASDAVILVGRK